MKKFLSLLLVIAVIAGVFTACTATENTESTTTTESTTVKAEKTNINIAVLKGPTGMGAAKLMDMNDNGETENKYNFTIATAPDQITAKLVSGELDIAFLPTNAVSALYNKTNGGVTLLGINTLGVLYILENGDTVNSIADLKGKKILTSGKGSTAEFVLNYLLEKNNIDIENDVEIEYVSEHSEVASKAASGNADIVMLPEPFVTSTLMQNSDFKVKINLTEEWNKIADSDLTMGAIGIRTEFLNNNKSAVESFLKEYEASVKFTVSDMENASALIEKYDIMKAAVAKQAIPNCNIVFITGEEMKKSASAFLTIVNDFDPSTIGGKLPEDNFYYLGK